MTRLIIFNADDLGMNSQRSHGIFQAFEFGVIRSASIICNGSDARTAARHARERDLTCGLHLNLTDGYPVGDPAHIGSLLQGNGEFYSRERLRTLLDEGRIDPDHLDREIRAQFEWILEYYGQPSHMDGHHHIHIHPTVLRAALPVMDRYAVTAIRIPAEDPLPPFGYVISDELLAKCNRITAEADEARKLCAVHGLRMTQNFRGLSFMGNASQKNLRHILGRLPEGATEFMTHPGSPTPIGSEFDRDPQRQTELQMLLNPEVPQILAERKITLGTFHDLP